MRQSVVAVQSPCVRNCCLNEQNICLGCFRSIDEIIQWGQASDAVKLKILIHVAERRLDRRLEGDCIKKCS